MKHIDAFGPNPRALRIFMAEKGIELEKEEINILTAENRKPPYSDRNPGEQAPAIELDDGTLLAETGAIFDYLEEKHPETPLIGTNAEERANTRMWHKRMEIGVTENMYNSFRFAEGHDMFKERVRCIPEAAEGLAKIVQDKLEWVEGLMADKPFIAGDKFTIADIQFFCAEDFMTSVGRGITADKHPKLSAWKRRMQERDSVKNSLHPAAAETKLAG